MVREKAQTKTLYTVIVSAPSGKCGCFLLSSSLFAICCKIMNLLCRLWLWRHHVLSLRSIRQPRNDCGYIMGLWVRRNPFHKKGERGGVYIDSITWWGHTTCTYYWVLRGRTDAPFLSHLNVLVNCQAAVKRCINLMGSAMYLSSPWWHSTCVLICHHLQ